MINIRPVNENDAIALRQLYTSVIDEKLPYILENKSPTVEEEKQFIQSILASGGIIFVAEDTGGLFLGMITVNRLSHPQLRHRASFGISVLGSQRNLGLGTQLIKRAILWCQENGIAQLSLEVMANNPAIALYKKLGFVVIGENASGVKVAGSYQPLFTMAFNLPDS